MNASTIAQGKNKLEVVSDIVRNGGKVRMPIWRLLGWFESERRGHLVVGGIRQVLKACQLDTRPDFADPDLNNTENVTFLDIPKRP